MVVKDEKKQRINDKKFISAFSETYHNTTPLAHSICNGVLLFSGFWSGFCLYMIWPKIYIDINLLSSGQGRGEKGFMTV